MEEIEQMLKEMRELASENEAVNKMEEEINTQKANVERANQKIQLSMVGSVLREVAQNDYNNQVQKLADTEKQKEELTKEANEKFKEKQEGLLKAIDKEMATYKTKSELDKINVAKKMKEIKTRIPAYEKVAENAQATIDKLMADVNNGKQIDFGILSNAQEELKANKGKIESLNKEIDGYKAEGYREDVEYSDDIEYKELESNVDRVSDLQYLKLRVSGLKLNDLNKDFENGFMTKYYKVNVQDDRNEQPVEETQEQDSQEINEQDPIIVGTSNEAEPTVENAEHKEEPDNKNTETNQGNVEKIKPEDIEVVGEPKNINTEAASNFFKDSNGRPIKEEEIETIENPSVVEPENNEQPEVDETKNSSNITQEDIDKAKKISDELKRNRYGVKTEFGEYNKTGNKIEEITCQTQLGIYMIKRADGSMQFFNAKGHGAIDKKSAEKIAEKFPNFSKKDLRNVDLNILKILQHEGFDDKQIEEYINGKQSKENKFTIIYKDDMNYDDYKDSLEETENLIAKEEKESKKPKYEIDEKSKLSELDKKEKKFLKKLARKQANREDTHIKYDYRTLGQKILDFFERRQGNFIDYDKIVIFPINRNRLLSS